MAETFIFQISYLHFLNLVSRFPKFYLQSQLFSIFQFYFQHCLNLPSEFFICVSKFPNIFCYNFPKFISRFLNILIQMQNLFQNFQIFLRVCKHFSRVNFSIFLQDIPIFSKIFQKIHFIQFEFYFKFFIFS